MALTDLPGRRDFNAEAEGRPGVTVGEDLTDRLATAFARIDRLETALRKIALGHPDGGPWCGGAEPIARAALDNDSSRN